jgi:hypothetical protein
MWLMTVYLVFIGLFDEVCDKFNISVPATDGNGNGSSSDASEVRAEKWTMDNGGSYGGSGGGGYSGGGGGGGSWRSGARSSVAGDALLGWALGGVACAITLGLMF